MGSSRVVPGPSRPAASPVEAARFAGGAPVIVGIDRIAVGGEGVGRHPDGRVAFVQGAWPGDRVEVEVTSERGRFVRARVLQFVDRVVVPSGGCAVSERCGGCQFQGAPAELELSWKVDAVLEAMRRIDRGLAWPTPTIHRSAGVDGYRERARLRVDGRGGSGFVGARTQETAVSSCCPVLHPEIERARHVAARAFAEVAGLRTLFLELDHERAGVALQLEVEPRSFGDARLRLRTLLSWHEERGDVLGVFSTIVLVGGDRRGVLRGDGTVWRRRGSARASVVVRDPTGGFSQAHGALNGSLVSHVAGALVGGGRLLEAYCGSGNFTFSSAGVFREVLALEGWAPAIEAARDAVVRARETDLFGEVERDDWAHVRFEVRDLERGVTSQEADVDAVLLDPPRGGASRALVEAIGAGRAARVVYVSCDPPALARDASLLAKAGFRCASLALFDMFPRTAHVEAVATLVRDGSESAHLPDPRVAD